MIREKLVLSFVNSKTQIDFINAMSSLSLKQIQNLHVKLEGIFNYQRKELTLLRNHSGYTKANLGGYLSHLKAKEFDPNNSTYQTELQTWIESIITEDVLDLSFYSFSIDNLLIVLCAYIS